jgi:glycosyltransferase involved in cell wall biosynthesis
MIEPRRGPRVIITAWRGSGGSLTHLAKVISRLPELRPAWRFELYAPEQTVARALGRCEADWVHPLDARGFADRLRWEFVDLPALALADPDALILSPFGPLLNLSLAPRAVWMARNIIPLLDLDAWELSEPDVLRGLALRYLFVSNAKVSRSVVCVSHHARERLLSLAGIAPERVHAVPHGVDPPAEPAAPVTGWMCTPYILHLGQLTPYRRTRQLIEAYADLARRRADVPRLVVAGEVRTEDEEYGATCMRQLEPLVAQGRALFAGRLTHSEALVAIGAAHAVAYPSVHEDCPNTVLEALAAGRVSVLADIPATRELAEGAALLVPDPTGRRLADALERAAFDGALRANLEVRARARAAAFTWSRSAEGLAAILERALDRGEAPARRAQAERRVG